MRIALVCIAALCLLVLLSQVAGQEKPNAKTTPVEATQADTKPSDTKPAEGKEADKFDFWMNVKLVESQRLFAALAQADFPAISESSRRLKTVSGLEGFVRRRTPGYLTQLKTFEFSVDEILLHAGKENIEGVTLGFQQLTLSCVNCHKQLR